MKTKEQLEEELHKPYLDVPQIDALKNAFKELKKITNSKQKPDWFFIFKDNPLYGEVIKNCSDRCKKYADGVILYAKK